MATIDGAGRSDALVRFGAMEVERSEADQFDGWVRPTTRRFA